jgi:hypothetical protein
MEHAAMADFHKALRQDVLEEPAETRHNVEVGGAWACTAHFTRGKSDRALRAADKTVVGESDLEDRGGEGGEGGAAMVMRLTGDVPGDGPDLGSDVLQQAGLTPLFFEERAVNGGEGFHGDKAVGSGGYPRCAVRGAATARDDGVEVGVGLELPAPGLQDPGKPRKRCADEPLVFGEPLECFGRGVDQSVVCEALLRAEKRA